ncbi:hypothetical protein P4S95_09340 [Aneurinibacillus aneurinilyticus]|uniref:hypothetical protein n=1 Tax=Aneurinibacillus aneurinilyticus TaxID=1391 RepID=UPI002E220E5D|nr:hypothetical protein [Aneurinibacillus aneurinilyticus]
MKRKLSLALALTLVSTSIPMAVMAEEQDKPNEQVEATIVPAQEIVTQQQEALEATINDDDTITKEFRGSINYGNFLSPIGSFNPTNSGTVTVKMSQYHEGSTSSKPQSMIVLYKSGNMNDAKYIAGSSGEVTFSVIGGGKYHIEIRNQTPGTTLKVYGDVTYPQ